MILWIDAKFQIMIEMKLQCTVSEQTNRSFKAVKVSK